jgi:hypothetical protein
MDASLSRNIDWFRSLSIVHRVSKGIIKLSNDKFPSGYIELKRRVIDGMLFYVYGDDAISIMFVKVDNEYHDRLLELVAKRMESVL